jgi:hypothetical protein
VIPPARKTPPRLERFKAANDAMLRSDLDAPKKQRHTARRILARLVDEHGAVGLSYSTVRDHIRKRRPQILAEAGRRARRLDNPRAATAAAGWSTSSAHRGVGAAPQAGADRCGPDRPLPGAERHRRGHRRRRPDGTH